MMADRLIGRTLASDVLHRMRGDIINVALRPGDRLRFEALRAQYGVSFSTLREALAHLVQEGLVVAEGQRGFKVAPLTRADLCDLVGIRIFIEGEALRRAVARGDAAWEQGIRAAESRLARVTAELGPLYYTHPDWQQPHRDFHDATVAACDSRILLDVRHTLLQRGIRYRRVAAQVLADTPIGPDDHGEMAAALVARDLPRAVGVVARQFRRTMEIMLDRGAHLLA